MSDSPFLRPLSVDTCVVASQRMEGDFEGTRVQKKMDRLCEIPSYSSKNIAYLVWSHIEMEHTNYTEQHTILTEFALMPSTVN